MQYKVGDRVRIVSEKTGYKWNRDGKMDKWLGEIMTVREVNRGSYGMEEDVWGCGKLGWSWYPEMIVGLAEEAKPEVIRFVARCTDQGCQIGREYADNAE